MTDQVAPEAAALEMLTRAALTRIPTPFAAHLADVVMLVEELADVYHGRPIGEKSAFDGVNEPDRIHLYRHAILYVMDRHRRRPAQAGDACRGA